MTIDTSQNVGIGTTTPAQKLHIQQTSAASSLTQLVLQNADNTTGTGSALGFANHTSSGLLTGKVEGAIDGANSYSMRFYTYQSGLNERMRIDSSGNLLVGTTSADAKFVVSGSATSGWGARLLQSAGSGTPQGLQVVVGQNSSNEVFQCAQGTSFTSPTNLFKVTGNGLINTGTATSSPYNNTTASAANMVVTSAGDLQRSTSSLKYKKNVQDATHGLADVLKLRAVTYEGKAETDVGKTFGGLIAEEVHDAGLTEFVQYAEDGTPDALAYGNMVSLCIKSIQELKALVDLQATEIAELKAKVGA
jgi:hypothetical protein